MATDEPEQEVAASKQDYERLARMLIRLGLFTGGAGFLSTLLFGMGRKLREPQPPDVDVDILYPPEVASAVKGAALHKQAQLPARAYWPAMAAAMMAGGGGGYLLGEALADRLVNLDLDVKLERAKRDFETALLKEQFAAAASGRRDPFAPYIKGAANGDEGFLSRRVLAPYLGLWALPTSVLTYLVLRDYLAQIDPERARYAKAVKMLQARLAAEQPHAQLTTEIPEKARKQLEKWRQQIKPAQQETAPDEKQHKPSIPAKGSATGSAGRKRLLDSLRTLAADNTSSAVAASQV